MSTLIAAVVQQRWTGDRTSMVAATAAAVRRAAAKGARLVVLQELHTGPYFCQVEDPALFDLAEPIPGPSTGEFSTLAKELGIVLVTSLFELRAPGLHHNTAVVHDTDGRIAGRYRKMHIPDDPAYYEKFYFTPGDLGFTPVETSLGKIGVLVCWDQWYPEAARLMSMAGADLLVYPTAIGWNPADDAAEKARQRDAWVTIQRAHAVANGLPVLVANRTGHEPDPSGAGPGLEFWGTSFIAGPQGEILAEAPVAGETELIATLDRARTAQVRRWWPYFRDRRIDAYGHLTRRWID
jgi:N-carbamoylputrescine amidase